MSEFPLPILVISDVVATNDTQRIGQLLEAGAVDVFPKPKTGFIQDYEKQKHNLVNKLKIISGVRVFTKRNEHNKPPIKIDNKPYRNSQLFSNRGRRSLASPAFSRQGTSDIDITNYQIVAIGVSTGGPKAMQQIISQLPADFPLPIVCTQHISVGFLNSLISWLSIESRIKITIAQIGEKPLPGKLYYAPEHYHLEIDCRGNFAYSQSPTINSHRPSATIMFQSLAQFYGKSIIGILLTGMGQDGVAGMQKIYQCGGLTIAQDENSSIIFGMPKEAIKLGVVKHILPLEQIAPFLLSQVNYFGK